ncbi:recombinase family protein [Spirosoma endbachense]|nr:recombinase family protein [Spirosoma endbachense]
MGHIVICYLVMHAFPPHRRPGQDQNLALQLDDLKKAGCQKIFQEKVSSAKVRPQLQRMLEVLREGDTVMVWKLDGTGHPAIRPVPKRAIHLDQ